MRRKVSYSAVQAILFGLSLLVSVACGTQTGNPPASDGPSKLTPLTPADLSAVMSLGFTEAVDGMNTGDYLFSNSESRVINQLNCRSDASGFGLVKATDTQHSVTIEASDRQSLAALSISRSYRDRWYQGEALVDCDPISGNPQIDPDTLADGDILQLVTSLDERKQRQLETSFLSASAPVLTQEQATRVEKQGERRLSFTLQEQDQKRSVWSARLTDQIRRQVQVEATAVLDEKAIELPMDVEGQDFSFSFVIDRNLGLIQEYRIDQQTLRYQLGDASLSMSFEELILVPAQGCFPQSGRLKAVWQQGQQMVEQVWTFQDGRVVSEQGGDDSNLLFFPEACVLNER